MNKVRVPTYVQAYEKFCGPMEIIRNPQWDGAEQTLSVPITEAPTTELSSVSWDGYYGYIGDGRTSGLVKIAELDGTLPLVEYTVEFDTRIRGGDMAMVWLIFRNPAGNKVAEYNQFGPGGWDDNVIQNLAISNPHQRLLMADSQESYDLLGHYDGGFYTPPEYLQDWSRAKFKMNFGGVEIETQTSGGSTGQATTGQECYKKALKYYDRRQERIIPLTEEGTVFKRVGSDDSFCSLEIGTAITGSCIQFIQSGLHTFRFEYQEIMPWVFAGTGGIGGYGL